MTTTVVKKVQGESDTKQGNILLQGLIVGANGSQAIF